MILKDKFEFHIGNGNGRIYRATKHFDSILIEWDKGKDNDQCLSYQHSEVIDNINKSIWIIIEEKSPVEIIEIGGYNHYFAKLENGEVLVFRAFDQTQHTSYTTITQQDFDSIKKIVDLT